jgi:hypothetical protein
MHLFERRNTLFVWISQTIDLFARQTGLLFDSISRSALQATCTAYIFIHSPSLHVGQQREGGRAGGAGAARAGLESQYSACASERARTAAGAHKQALAGHVRAADGQRRRVDQPRLPGGRQGQTILRGERGFAL